MLPWSDSLPTRVNITKGNSPEPVPSWLEDVDDEPAAAGPAEGAGATPLQDRLPATTDGAHGVAAATDDAQADADAWGGTEAADESTATWRISSAQPASGTPESGTLAATWSALGYGDAAPAEAVEEASAAADAPRSWGDASWKADSVDTDTDTDPDDDVAPVGEAGSGAHVDADDTASATEDTATEDSASEDSASEDSSVGIVDTGRTGVDDAGRGDAADREAADTALEASGLADTGLAASGLADTGLADTGSAQPEEDVADGEAEPGDAGVPGAQQVTVVPGVPRYHEPNCILIRFMPADDVHRMSVPEAEEAGCTPCRACQPE